MTRMQFRLTYDIKAGAGGGYLFDDRELPATFQVGAPRPVTVVLRREQVDGQRLLLAEALANIDAPPRAEQQLRSWRNGQDLATLGALREFGESLLRQLHSDIEAVLRLIRWRCGMPGPAKAIRSSHGMQWSDDGQEWHFFPLEGKARPATYVAVRLTPEQIAQIEAMYRTSEEPFAHVLFREADELLFTHTASALVIGVAALEIRVKALIGDLVPGAAWLAENVQSPPLEKLIGEYLPKLPARVPAHGELSFPAATLAMVKKGVLLRNQTAHRGNARLDPYTVADVLETVRDLLWLCDYLAGHAWALGYVSHALRRELGYLPDD
jgi:hypothetical protein